MVSKLKFINFIIIFFLALLIQIKAIFSSQDETGKTKTDNSLKNSEAKKLFKKGVEFFEKNDYENALNEFQQSYNLNPHWAVRYNIGLCLLKLGYEADAAGELSLYLEEGGKNIKNSVKREVDKILSDLIPELGMVVIYGDLQGISVYADGRKIPGPTIKGELYVKPGNVELVMYRNERIILKKVTSIEKGEILEIDLKKEEKEEKQQKLNEQPPGEKEIIKKENIAVPPSDAGKEKVQQTESIEKEKYKRGKGKGMIPMLYVWITVGIAGATLGAGSAMGFLAVNERDKMRSDEDSYRNNPSHELLSNIDEHYDRGKAYASASTALLSVGAAAGVASIILYVLSGIEKKENKDKNEISIILTPGVKGLNLKLLY